jgi:hypothetical protein
VGKPARCHSGDGAEFANEVGLVVEAAGEHNIGPALPMAEWQETHGVAYACDPAGQLGALPDGSAETTLELADAAAQGMGQGFNVHRTTSFVDELNGCERSTTSVFLLVTVRTEIRQCILQRLYTPPFVASVVDHAG